MINNNRKNYICIIAILFVFLMLTAFIIAMLFSSAKVYKNLIQQGNNSYFDRTVSSFLLNKIRSVGENGTATIVELDDLCALCLSETIDEKTCKTYIYLSDGYIKELFSVSDAEFNPAAGEKLIRAESLDFSIEEGLFHAEFSQNGTTVSDVYMDLKGAGVS